MKTKKFSNLISCLSILTLASLFSLSSCKRNKVNDDEEKKEDKVEEKKEEEQKQDEPSGEEVIEYVITWYNYNDEILATSKVKKGEVPIYEGETPTKPEDEQYTYVFAGWTPVVVEASSNFSYKATFNAIQKVVEVEEDSGYQTANELIPFNVLVEDEVIILEENNNGNYEITNNNIDSTYANGVLIIPSKYNNKIIESIGDQAFANNEKITKVVFSSSLKNIGESAFNSCVLTEVTLPENIISVGASAFDSCESLTKVVLNNTQCEFGESVFNYCSELSDVTIKEGFTIIPETMFYYCTALESITFPSSLKTIDNEAFSASALKTINLNEGLININEGAFSEIGLEDTMLTIPSTVTNIQRDAFMLCDSLESVLLLNNNGITIHSYAFRECSSISSVYYYGSQQTADNIAIDYLEPENNVQDFTDYFTEATKYYYSENQPSSSGNYWHFNTDNKTPVEW